MASGRVGGTKSKVSGQVGSEIYSVRRNDDGSYSQIVSAKAEHPRYSNTEKQAAYRMATAVVESAMRDLATIGRMSIQSAPNATKSLNAFARLNLHEVFEDMKANWYGNGRFLYNLKGESQSLGGRFLLSQGTLQANHFSGPLWGYGYPSQYDHSGQPIPSDWHMYGGINWDTMSDDFTVGDWLRKKGYNRNEVYVYVAYVRTQKWDEHSDPEDPQVIEDYHFTYAIITFSQTLPDSTKLTKENLDKFFVIHTNGDFVTMKENYYFRYSVFLKIPESDLETAIISHGAFTITDWKGYKQIKTAYMQPVHGWQPWDWIKRYPAKVFYSWLGETTPSVKPNPFE